MRNEWMMKINNKYNKNIVGDVLIMSSTPTWKEKVWQM